MKLIEKALSQYGIEEMAGREENSPEILEYFADLDYPWVKTDETSWCSAFVNWVAQQCGYEFSGKLDARSWLNYGDEVYIPAIGDLAIFWRIARDDWRGHVGFFVRETEDTVFVLGGNQDNKVCVKEYPKEGRRIGLIGYRRLRKLREK